MQLVYGAVEGGDRGGGVERAIEERGREERSREGKRGERQSKQKKGRIRERDMEGEKVKREIWGEQRRMAANIPLKRAPLLNEGGLNVQCLTLPNHCLLGQNNLRLPYIIKYI